MPHRVAPRPQLFLALPFAGRLAPHPKGSASSCAPSFTSSYLSPPNTAFVRSLSHSETFFTFLLCIGLSQTLGWSWHSRLSDLVLPPLLGPFSLTLCLDKMPTLPIINFNPASPRHPARPHRALPSELLWLLEQPEGPVLGPFPMTGGFPLHCLILTPLQLTKLQVQDACVCTPGISTASTKGNI